jgi:hypothetical protein
MPLPGECRIEDSQATVNYLEPAATLMVMLKNRTQKNNPDSIHKRSFLNAPALVRPLRELKLPSKLYPEALTLQHPSPSFYKILASISVILFMK